MPDIPTDFDPTIPSTVEKEPQLSTADVFRDRLNTILERPLTPTNISEYAYSALGNLISLIHDVVDTCRVEGDTDSFHDLDTEEVALSLYGLGSVEPMLDYLSDMHDDITRLDEVLDSAEILDQNVLPTSDQIRFPERGVSLPKSEKDTESEKEIIERAKVVLFVLEREFNIDVRNTDECSTRFLPARTQNNRRTDFYLIQVPKLERSILVCNGKNQATFIFDNHEIEQSDENLDDILACDKLEIKQILTDKPELGKWIKYSDDFFAKAAMLAIHNPRSDYYAQSTKSSFLVQKAPAGVYSEREARALVGGVAPETFRDVVAELREELGDIPIKSFDYNPSSAFDDRQLLLIKTRLQEINIACPLIPETHRFAKDLATEWGIGYEQITAAAEILAKEDSEFGKIEYFRRPKIRSWPGYSPSQISKIHDYLKEKKLFYPRATENDFCANSIADKFSSTESRVRRAIASLGDSIGPTDEKMHHSRVATNYTLEQALMVIAEDKRLQLQKKVTKKLATTALKS